MTEYALELEDLVMHFGPSVPSTVSRYDPAKAQ